MRKKLFPKTKIFSIRRYFPDSKNNFKDHYKVLGLKRGCSMEDLRKTYSELSRKYHPDVSTRFDAQERFIEIKEAYEFIREDIEKFKGKGSSSQSYSNYYSKNRKEWSSKSGYGEKNSSGTQSNNEWNFSSPEEFIYYKVFQKRYEENPMFYFLAENAEKRKKFKEMIKEHYKEADAEKFEDFNDEEFLNHVFRNTTRDFNYDEEYNSPEKESKKKSLSYFWIFASVAVSFSFPFLWYFEQKQKKVIYGLS